MSGKLAPIDFVITIGAFILTLGLYKMVKPVLFRSYATEAEDANEQAILKRILADMNKRSPYGTIGKAELLAAQKQARAEATAAKMLMHKTMTNVKMMQASHSQDEILGLAKTNPYRYNAADPPFPRRKRMDYQYTDCKAQCAKCLTHEPSGGAWCETCQDDCEGYQDERGQNAANSLKKSDVTGQRMAKHSTNKIVQNPMAQFGNYIANRVNQMFAVAPPLTGAPMAPPILAYAATRLVSDEIGSSGEFTVEQCAQTESKECCKLAEQEGMVTEESMTNCHLCHHPDCTGVVAQQDDPAISLPFKKNIAPIIKPKNRELYDYVNQYARAYTGRVSYV